LKHFRVTGRALRYTGRMEKAARVFHSFAEADQADSDYYRSLTPEQRLAILFELVKSQQPDGTEQRLERVYRIIKLQED